MEILKKYLTEKFQEHLTSDFNSYCEKHKISKNDDLLITYLIDQDLIDPSKVQKYTIQREYDMMSSDNPCPKKTYAVETLSSRFAISERTVWSILKNKTTVKDNSKHFKQPR